MKHYSTLIKIVIFSAIFRYSCPAVASDKQENNITPKVRSSLSKSLFSIPSFLSLSSTNLFKNNKVHIGDSFETKTDGSSGSPKTNRSIDFLSSKTSQSESNDSIVNNPILHKIESQSTVSNDNNSYDQDSVLTERVSTSYVDEYGRIHFLKDRPISFFDDKQDNSNKKSVFISSSISDSASDSESVFSEPDNQTAQATYISQDLQFSDDEQDDEQNEDEDENLVLKQSINRKVITHKWVDELDVKKYNKNFPGNPYPVGDRLNPYID